MPITLIHIKIAGMFAEKDTKYNNSDFYLGNIAPDAVNLERFAPKKERWESHIRRENLNEWKQAVIEFYKKEKYNYPQYFILGYIVHILTDIIYDKNYYDKVINTIKTENPHKTMLNDMELYVYEHNKEVLNLKLKQINKYYDILNINKTNLSLFVKKLMLNKNIKEKSKYINDKLIENLFQDVYKEIQKIEEK